jgi:hypothetical protein
MIPTKEFTSVPMKPLQLEHATGLKWFISQNQEPT